MQNAYILRFQMEQLPKKSDAEQSGPHDDTANKYNDRIDATAARVIAALTKINRANRKADKAENERNHRREKRRFTVEQIEIALVAVYAFVTILEWKTFERERQTMEDEFKSSQTNNAVTLDVATNELGALRGQLDAMKETTELDERAWIYPQLMNDALVLDGTNLTFYVLIKNAGKTPALLTGGIVRAAVDFRNIARFDQETGGAEDVLLPDESLKMPLSLPPGIVIYNGFNPVYVYGTVWYQDIFHNRHWTQYCYLLSQNGRITSQVLNTHGLTDDIETNQAR